MIFFVVVLALRFIVRLRFPTEVLMSIVDAKYRFVWGSCGFPGNSHDSIILQSTKLWSDIKDGKVLPPFVQKENEAFVPPLLLGDSAFPFETFLMKPYTNAVLSEQQSHFNYRLSRARMVVEGAYGQLKGRWRHLMRKSIGEGGLRPHRSTNAPIDHGIDLEQVYCSLEMGPKLWVMLVYLMSSCELLTQAS